MEEREDKLQDSRWHKWKWVAAPELVHMMLDYYDFLSDSVLLQEKIVPVANDIMKFFDNFYTTNEDGKWVMNPSKIYLLPAWPREWDIDFKLHAPKNTVITGKVVNGEIQSLDVTPVSRKNDMVIYTP